MRCRALILIMICIVCISYTVSANELSMNDRAKKGEAISLIKVKNYSQALDILRELNKDYPNDAEISRAYFTCLSSTQNYNEALDLLDEVYKDELNSKEYYDMKIKLYEGKGLFAVAASLYVNMYEKQLNTDTQILWMAAERYSWAGENEKAVIYFEKYESHKALTNEEMLMMADVLFWARKYDKALVKYQSVKDQVFKDEKRSLQYCQSYLMVDELAAVNECMQASHSWPENLDIKAQYASALYKTGDVDKAEKIFEELASLNPTDLKLQEQAIRVLASVKRYEKAKQIAHRVLQQSPEYLPVRLWLARILSWNREYVFSVDQYDILIAQDSSNIVYYRERARVLSWMRKYKKSEQRYKEAKQKFDDKAIKFEANAMYDINRYYYRWAKINLDQLRKLEPNNHNAKIESALLYSELGLWNEANLLYQNILKNDPQMLMVNQAYNKNRIYSEDLMFELGAQLYETDSKTRSADVFYYDVYSKVRAPINEKIYLYNVLSDRFYRFPTLRSRVNRYRQDIGLQLYLRPTLWIDLAGGYADKSDKVESSYYGHFDLVLEHYDPFTFNALYQRDDVVENVTTLIRHLQKDDYKLRVRLDTQKRYYFGADYTFSNYTDGNEKQLYGADITYHLFYEPRRLSLQYRIEEYKFKEPRDWYFTPSSFHRHGIGLEWRHYLNEDEMFWGANDTYYTLRYGVDFDSGDQHGHKFYFDFHKDWTDSLSSHFEYEHTLFEHKEVYEQRGIRFYIRWYW